MTSLILLACAALGPSSVELEERGRLHLYNMDFEQARSVFGELGESDERSPAGPYYEATVLWMKELTARGGLSGATFRTNHFWSRTRKAPPPPELDRDFKRLVAESIARSESTLERHPEDSEALYFQGAAYGLLSAYHATMEHRYYPSYRAGKRAKELHEKLTEIDPDYADAYLLPGIYDYTVATLPRTLRWLGFLVGVRGSKEQGIERVERAVEKGNRTRWVARLSLAVIYEREKRYTGALRFLHELERAFPRNPLLTLESGTVHLLRKDYRAARRVFEKILTDQSSGKENFEEVPRALVYLRLGESHLFAKEPASALEAFDGALRTPNVPETIRAAVFLRRGMASDARGERKAAEWDYRRALEVDADATTNSLANRYLKRPYR